MLELNEVCLRTDNATTHSTLSLMAEEGQLTCLTGGSASVRSRLLLAMLGLAPLSCGYISIDGEPVCDATAAALRRLMAYVPRQLQPVGSVTVYEAPSETDVFSLHANRKCDFSDELLRQRVHDIDPGDCGDERVRLLAVASLMQRQIVLVDDPPAVCAPFLHDMAAEGRVVIVSTDNGSVTGVADQIVEL